MTIVLLTFNRPDHIRQRVREVCALGPLVGEILVVDNCSNVPAAEACDVADGRLRFIRTQENLGAVARNRAFEIASGEIIICLDDDVFGLTDGTLDHLLERFRDPSLGAVNFRVADPISQKPMNWCHHYDVDSCWQRSFVTNEISEGAVAFSRRALEQTGFYPESFFISHEGPDMAFRLLNQSFRVEYDPAVVVFHEPATEARVSWRRYYYDTRNVFWLVARNFPLFYGLRRLVRENGALFVYAVRDGYLRYWFKGCLHGIGGLGRAFRERRKPLPQTMRLIKHIDSHRPPLWKVIKRRVFRRGVQI
ncbi:glycosyltransferase family 2 protein [Peristeroidobacter agariperforans]|uniref:glycosyltransferase family 2 protein n=1 Tax=Peristeroidobacter agariperforans TaxID=268404 RepID=UPI0013007AA4|nr:glycosyltransferase [Peristeroidobacter agariperforans]